MIKRLFFSITIRFQEKEALLDTFYFLDIVDEDKLSNPALYKEARELKFIIAKELCRRRIEFWQ